MSCSRGLLPSRREAIAAILQDFGDFTGPHLVRMYRTYILPEWKTLDVIEHTEECIHKMVRLQHKGARPPYLSTTRRSEDEIVVHYASKRKLCSLAKGFATGIARHYGETLRSPISRACTVALRRVRS